jgi:hypothetical protein
MKKYFLFAILFLVALFSTPIRAQEVAYEHISEFNSSITINQDATIDVTEEINYYFDTPRHGIIWQYPIDYSVSGFRRATSFDLEEMYYYPKDNPQARKSVYEITRSTGWIELKIGEADRTITGSYVYVIKYSLQDVGISYFDTHDEVYFNVIGPGWQVPILKANAYIETFMEPTERICFTGSEGSTENSCEFSQSDEGIILTTTSSLGEYEALTFALKFPPDSIEDRTKQVWIGLIISNLGIFLPIPVGIFLVRLLKKKWKNEKLTVIPHYEAPDGIDPLLAGYIYKGRYDFKHVSASIIWLATKGFLTLEIDGRKTFINKSKAIEGVKSYIQDLFTALFSKDDSVNIKKMPTSFVSKIQGVFSTVAKEAVSMGYIDKGRVSTKSLLTVLGSLVAGGTLFVLFPIFAVYAAVGTAIGIVICGVIMLIVGSKVDIRSKEGNELYHELEIGVYSGEFYKKLEKLPTPTTRTTTSATRGTSTKT